MFQLLKIEWLKVKAYPAFWWVMGITALAYPATTYAALEFYKKLITDPRLPGQAIKMTLGNPFAFNEVWHTVAYLSSFFIFFPSIVVIMLITNEYSFKTHRQNIINGWSRRQFMTAKLLDVIMVAVLISLLYVAVCLLIGGSNTRAEDKAGEDKVYFVGYFLLQTFSQLSIAFLIGFLLREAFIALSVFIFLFLVLEPSLIALFASKKIAFGHFLPFELSDNIIPPPGFLSRMDPVAHNMAMNATGYHFAYTLVFTFVLWLFCYWLNAKRDI